MAAATFMIYGANGYTGRLIAERAVSMGHQPILAGRNRAAVVELAEKLGLQHRVFELGDSAGMAAELEGASLVLHCAGPYSRTSRPMVDACLRASVHYLDITGEYAVLEAVLSRDEEAKAKGVVLMPAVGFDVVPTDCMAAKLHQELPDATHLELAFSGGLVPSPGTAKTTVEGLHVGSLVRRDGKLVALKAPVLREVPFGDGKRFTMSIPWGDIVTAFHSTGIPNITVYTVVPKAIARMAPLLSLGAPFLRSPRLVRFLQSQVQKRAKGPTEEQRKSGRMFVWGRVENASGRSVEGRLEVPDGYELTARTAVAAAERVLRGDVRPGATTPSRAFGADFVTSIEGVGELQLMR